MFKEMSKADVFAIIDAVKEGKELEPTLDDERAIEQAIEYLQRKEELFPPVTAEMLDIYYKVQYDFVAKDIRQRAEDMCIALDDGQIASAAKMYNEVLDCTRTYWDNIDDLIERVDA